MCKYDMRYRCNKPFNLRIIIFRVFVTMLIFLGLTILASTVYANGSESVNKPDLNGTTRGSVWLLPKEGVYIEALQLEAEVNMDVSDMINRAKVNQRFRNTSHLWAEGLYVFPLPENAAVDHFRILIDGRVIEGEIQEKAQARNTYEIAKHQGKRTGLVEQQRANIFTTRLANIAPGAEMTVEIEYQQTLTYRDGYYSLRFPLVVGERYITPSKEGSSNPEYDLGVFTESSTTSRELNPTSITINMDTGIPITNIVSNSHPVNIVTDNENKYTVSLRDNKVPADRDFQLKWEPELGKLPEAAVFNQVHDGYDYSLITIYPPENDLYNPINIPRDIVFILDVSGSMSGTSIEQAKSALGLALERLKPSDKFNIIWFNHQANKLYFDSQQATIDRVNAARRHVGSLNADGGTEMMPALKLAFAKKADPEYLRQVVFFTDGNVSNERDLFNYIKSNLGNSRLFTVGIGSAPNGFFMKRAANAGRGTYTFIRDIQEVAKKTGVLLRKLETPALTDIKTTIKGHDIEYYHNPIPDMYVGEPVTIVLRGKDLSKSISVEGKIGANYWRQLVSLDKGYNNKGISTAWARKKIAALSESYHDASDNALKEYYKNKIIDVSISNHLVSQYTSLVAVDKTPVNYTGNLHSERLKNNLPYGWERQKNDNLMIAQINLPQTATGYPGYIVFAMLFFAVSILLGFARMGYD